MAAGVEHEDRVVADALDQQAVAFLAFAQRRLRGLAVGHVLADAEHLHRLSGVVADHFAGASQDADFTIRTDDALVEPERAAGLQYAGNCAADPLAVVGMDAFEVVLEGAAKLARPHAVDVVDLLGPTDLAAADVPRPAAEVGEALRLQQVDALLFQLGLDVAPFLDLGLQCGDGAPNSPVRWRTCCSSCPMGVAQVRLGAPAHRNVGAEHQTRRRGADDEGKQQQKRIVERRGRERPAVHQRAPDREAGQDQRGRRGVTLAPQQRCEDQRQDGEKAERTAHDGLLDQRTERDHAHRDGEKVNPGGCRGAVRRGGRAVLGRQPEHDDRRDHEGAGGVAKPPSQPDGRETLPIGKARQREAASADGGADERARRDAERGKPGDADRGVERLASV